MSVSVSEREIELLKKIEQNVIAFRSMADDKSKNKSTVSRLAFHAFLDVSRQFARIRPL